jgi:microcystin degradation protein MlrC
MRIAIAQLSHETNTLSVQGTDQAAFSRLSWLEGEEILSRHRGTKSYIGGVMDEAELVGGVSFAPIFAAQASPAGKILKTTWEAIRSGILDGLRDAGEVDAVYLDLHGAGVAEGCDDIEGDILEGIRRLVGPSIPIVTTLDLHGNITERMVRNADMMFGIIEYPHIDYYDRGREAFRNLRAMIAGEIEPVMYLARLPMIIPLSTALVDPALSIKHFCLDQEKIPGIIDCTFFHGFAYTSSPARCSSVLVIADRNQSLAAEVADDVARHVLSRQHEFFTQLPGAEDALEAAMAAPKGPVVVNEMSDNPGAGGPGDGTRLLGALLAKNPPRSIFSHIADADVVRVAREAREGAVITVKLGGKTDAYHGAPLTVTGKVLCNTTSNYTCTGPMDVGRKYVLGKSTLLLIGNVEVLVTEFKSQMVNGDLLAVHNRSPNCYDLICIKSTHHFRAFFDRVASYTISTDTGGISTADISSLGLPDLVDTKSYL